jgi:hypothetical protein
LRFKVTVSPGLKPAIRNGPPDGIFSGCLSRPLFQPPGWRRTWWDGSRLANRLFHSANGWLNTTVTVLPSSEPVTRSIRS